MKSSILPFLFGILLGSLLAFSIKYPVSVQEINRIKVACASGEYTKFKVGVTGVIYEVTCKNQKTFSVKERVTE